MPVQTIPIPPRSQVGYPGADILGEGAKVVSDNGAEIQYASGEKLSFNAKPLKPNFPDWSEIKSIERYFNRSGYEPWPAWFYHPTEEPRLIKDQAEGATVGVYYRMPTPDETARFGVIRGVWDWAEGCQWRPTPYRVAKFDPKNPGHGKEYVDPMRDPGTANRFMVQELAKAIGQSLVANGPQAPAAVDPAMWEEFMKFKAWQKASEVVGTAATEAAATEPASPSAQGSLGSVLDHAVREAARDHGKKR